MHPAALPDRRPRPGRGGLPVTRRPPASNRWIVTGVIALVICGLVVVGLLVIYPRVGAWMIRDKLSDKVEAKLGRGTQVGAIEVSLGHAVLRDVQIRGPNDGNPPLVHIERIEVDFDPWRSLVGSVRLGAAKITGVSVTLRRGDSGTDNFSDVIDRLR